MNKFYQIIAFNIFLFCVILPVNIAMAEFNIEHDNSTLPLYEPNAQIIVKFKEKDKGGIDLKDVQEIYLNNAFFLYMPANYQSLIINKAIGGKVEKLIKNKELKPLVKDISTRLIDMNIIIFSRADDLVLETVAELNKEQSIEYAEPNFMYYPSTSDEYYNNLWYLEQTSDADIDYPEALSLYNKKSNINKNIIVAIVDTGIEYTHPDLSGNMWTPTNCLDHEGKKINNGCPNHGASYQARGVGGWNIIRGDDPKPLDLDSIDSSKNNFWAYKKSNSHGTHVAGIVGAVHNNIGIAGIAPDVNLMALKVNGDTPGLSVAAAASAIDFARHNGAKVVNASYGGDNSRTRDAFSITHYNAVKRLKDAGILFVAAAGNGDPNNANLGINLDSTFVSGGNYKKATYPCAYSSDSWSNDKNWDGLDNVICVAATNSSDGITYYSNYGKKSVHVGAPGGTYDGLYSTIPAQYAKYENLNVNYDYKSGTSMATPVVTGLAAMIWAYQPNLTYSQVKDIILSTGDSLSDLNNKTITGKRVNIYEALKKVDKEYGDDNKGSCDTAPVIVSPKSNKTINGKVKLQWQSIANANSYNVRYSTSSNLTNAKSSNVLNNYLDLTLDSGTYYWQVQAVCP